MLKSRRTTALYIAITLSGCASPVDGDQPPLLQDPTAVASVTQAAATPQTQNVKVVNAGADWVAPVPTVAQGTTSVAGTVSASQSGNWSVGISGTPAVSAEQSGAWTVTAEQGSGPWDVSISGTPSVSVIGTTDVNVTNSPSVTVLGTPSVNVSSMPAVSIGNTPNVTIANTPTTPANVRDADHPGRRPFQKMFNLFVVENSNGDSDRLSLPFGKRFVIENVTAKAIPPIGQAVWIEVVTLGSQDSVQYFPMTKVGSQFSTQDIWVMNQNTSMYADNLIDVYVIRNDFSGELAANVTVSGYIIDN